MSGIFGVFNLDGAPVRPESIHGMLEASANCGFDAEGTWTSGYVGLGHRQLRTTPESLNEEQPLVSGDQRYAITCDGRVDNRGELIQALRGKARVDSNTSDANLILCAYIAWGPNCLKRITGDFAFAIWDGSKQELFCARDPMGVRTVYYFQGQNRFIFGSDINSVLAAAGIARDLNQLMVSLYLLGEFGEGEQTFFNGILQVLPATYMLISQTGVDKQVYWEPDPWQPIKYKKTEEYVEHLKDLLFEAVNCRLRSSSPVAITLSGGLDSTSIACISAHLISQGNSPGTRLETYSSVFKDFPSSDESNYISKVLQAWDLKSNYLYSDEYWGLKSLQDSKLRFSRPYPVPFQARHEYFLASAKLAGIRTVLTGEGGDEFCNAGYQHLIDCLIRLQWRSLRRELKCLTPDSRRGFWRTAVSSYRSNIWDASPGMVQRLYRKTHPKAVPEWLNEDFIHNTNALEHQSVVLPPPRSRSLYRQGQYAGCIGLPRLPFLHYITEMYSHYQVEARHPFYDRRVIDYLIRVPPHLKFSMGWSKLLLRKAMDGLLPDEVRLRSVKSNFGEVLYHGAQMERTRIQGLLEGGYLVESGWVKKLGVGPLLDRFSAGESRLNGKVIALITLEEWLGSNFGSNGSEGPLRPSCLAQKRGQERSSYAG